MDAELPSFAGSIALSFVSLGIVCLLAYVALRWLSQRGMGRGDGPLKVVARCSLEPRRSVYLIEAGGRCFLVGAGDGSMVLLAEIDAATVKTLGEARTEEATRFAQVLAKRLKMGTLTGSPDSPAMGSGERSSPAPDAARIK